ncbi:MULTISPECIES: hypothetical protein [unclassified Flavobacterium]|uniref:hypothetical protein n=1 Tax=unclassified Flavobacterium TaxID=196869 RepID=UPI000868433C|nr:MULTISPECIES: hypothetical protein [unclassified Flavobacterium]MBN9284134.1 hypothetical protein [Flavobacterium sp.]ODS83601.1 MAG: hypothetical protein ABS44_17255 [Chryseobacterium sp. SCN 40-13]OJV71147.1 MAG: hypothetical protein BGO42_04870 [Flavobacterium sp. 40-81]
MDNQDNRIERELSQWKLREGRLEKLLSFSLSSNKALLKEKLIFFDRITTRYASTLNPDERFALRALKHERRDIERRLYPNPLLRLLRRPLREKIVANQESRQLENNSRELQREIQKAGFAYLTKDIEKQMKSGQPQFSVSSSHYINETESLQHRLSFAKDSSGNYCFEGYSTALYNEKKTEESRQQFFKTENGLEINSIESYNLLSGRAVEKDGKWLQLNFNDRDPQGNYRMKEFHSDFGYQLDKVLDGLPIKEKQDYDLIRKLNDNLKQGNREVVSFVKDGNLHKFYLEANPQYKSVTIYDEHSKKVTLNAALGNKTSEGLKTSHKLNEQQKEGAVKRNGVKLS